MYNFNLSCIQNLEVVQIFQCLGCLYVLSSINDTKKHKCDALYFQIISLVDSLHPILNQLQVLMLPYLFSKH